jgi:sirohydrochlorin ferrochelatase
MHALLLIAHGSRREASNREVRELTAKLEQLARERFDRVVPAFLELAEPDIQTAVDICAEAGARTITVVPYFLAPGRHVASDIPAELGEAARRHPTLSLYQSDHLGKHASIPELLLALGLEAQDDPGSKPQQTIGIG